MPTLIVPKRNRFLAGDVALVWPTKAPVNRDIYALDLTLWLAELATDGVIAAAAVYAAPVYRGGIVIDQVAIAAAVVSARLAGGIPGVAYQVVFTATTSGGRTRVVPTQMTVEQPA